MLYIIHKTNFLQLCKDRGYSEEDAMRCIVSQNGDTLTVDKNSPYFPKSRPIAIIAGPSFSEASSQNIKIQNTISTQISGSFRIEIPDTLTNTGDVIKHLPVILNDPIFDIMNYEHMRLIVATTKNLPANIVLYTPIEYNASLDSNTLIDKLKSILGDNPQQALQSIINKKFKK